MIYLPKAVLAIFSSIDFNLSRIIHNNELAIWFFLQYLNFRSTISVVGCFSAFKNPEYSGSPKILKIDVNHACMHSNAM